MNNRNDNNMNNANNNMAQTIKANGEIANVMPKNGTDFSLEELKGFVGGYIEIVNVNVDGKTMLMVVNEEGKLMGLPINEKATALCPYDVIVGDVLICDLSQIQ